MTDHEIKAARMLCEELAGIGEFLAYARLQRLFTLVPALLDEVEAFAGYDKELAAVGERTGRLVAAFEAEREALRAEVDRTRPVYEAAKPWAAPQPPWVGENDIKLAEAVTAALATEAMIVVSSGVTTQ